MCIHFIIFFISYFSFDFKINIPDTSVKLVKPINPDWILSNGTKITEYYTKTKYDEFFLFTDGQCGEHYIDMPIPDFNYFWFFKVPFKRQWYEVESLKDKEFISSPINGENYINDIFIRQKDVTEYKLVKVKHIIFYGIFRGYSIEELIFYLLLPFIFIMLLKFWNNK